MFTVFMRGVTKEEKVAQHAHIQGTDKDGVGVFPLISILKILFPGVAQGVM